ncbi:MAG: hypothetical protein RL571_3377 [Pseudomonadota bacterium]|jgi:uncharacterized Zn-binding protein involved in type VI secretion
MKRVIRLGDQTSHGEVVISAASTSNMFGKPITPKELLISLERSNRMVGKINYPKVAK